MKQHIHRRALAAAALAALLLACTDSKPSSAPTREEDAGPAEQRGIHSLCDNPRVEAVDWTERTALGISPREAFSAVAGICTAPFVWDARVLNDRVVEPRQADSEITITVTIDETSARLVRPAEGAPSPPCPSYLEVDARVQLKTADGTFAETAKSTARYDDRNEPRLAFDIAVGKQGGSLSIALAKNEQGTLSFSLDGAGESCAGGIDMTFSLPEPAGSNGAGSGGTAGFVGQWSRTGCPLGQRLFDLTEPRGDGQSVVDDLLETWGDASYAGTWDDGIETMLRVQLAVDATSVCGIEGDLSFPVQVTYGSDDGRIVPHETEASVHVGSDIRYGLSLLDEIACEGAKDTLDYTRVSCADFESATLHWLLNDLGGGHVEVSGEGVGVYAMPRAAGQEPHEGMLTLENPNR